MLNGVLIEHIIQNKFCIKVPKLQWNWKRAALLFYNSKREKEHIDRICTLKNKKNGVEKDKREISDGEERFIREIEAPLRRLKQEVDVLTSTSSSDEETMRA